MLFRSNDVLLLAYQKVMKDLSQAVTSARKITSEISISKARALVKKLYYQKLNEYYVVVNKMQDIEEKDKVPNKEYITKQELFEISSKELEEGIRISNLLETAPEKVTQEELKKNALIQTKVLNIFNQFLVINNHTLNLGRILSTNKTAGQTIQDITDTLQAIKDLNLGHLIGADKLSQREASQLPFNLTKAIENNPNILGNIKRLNQLKKILGLFFIEATPKFEEFINRIKTSGKIENSELLTYLAIQAEKNGLFKAGIDITSFNSLLYKELKGELMIDKFYNIIEKYQIGRAHV